MPRWVADQTVAHLRDVADWPDLGSRYEVRARLGRGGMGSVFAAYDRSLQRDVAVKVIAADRASGVSARLLSEAAVLARLEHPGIIAVHDAGTLPDGRVFYVMKLVRGERLGDRLTAASLPVAQLIEIFLRVCDTVAFAHSHGIVHCDLKPENIMLGPFGEVLVMDWGAALMLRVAERRDAVIVGTPGFMAPEQTQPGSMVDHRADIYALGTLLDLMLPSPLPRPLSAIVKRACAARAEDRYATVAALAQDISNFRDGVPVSAHRETVVEHLARFYRRYRLPILLVLAYILVRVILLVWFRV